MTNDSPKQAAIQTRSTQPGFNAPESFKSIEEELLYYKEEYQRLKAIITLQKQKIKKLIAGKEA